MRTYLFYSILGIVIVLLMVWTWRGMRSTSDSGDLRDVRLICARPDCGAEFELSSEQVTGDYPRGAGGYQCPQCGEFSAHIARQCYKCKAWYLAMPSKSNQRQPCPQCGR